MRQCCSITMATVPGWAISWKNMPVVNNSLLSTGAIKNRINENTPGRFPLLCTIVDGQWYAPPSGDLLRTSDSTIYGGYGQRNVSGGVELYRGSEYDIVLGAYCCRNTTVTLCVGLHVDIRATNDVGISNDTSIIISKGATIFGRISLQVLEMNPLSFRLTCVSTGSPATSVQWTIDGSPLNDVNYTTSQRITDLPTFTYHNVLTVTGRLVGEYTCNVTTSCPGVLCGTNTLSFQNAISRYNLVAPPTAPANVVAVQTSPTSVNVSWNASSGPVVRYNIYYEANRVPITVIQTTSTYFHMTNLAVGTNYIISVLAMGTYLSSEPTQITIALGSLVVNGSMTIPTAGSSYTLSCYASIIQWKGELNILLQSQNGSLLDTVNQFASPGMTYSAQMSFSTIFTSNGGVYLCTTTYGSGSFTTALEVVVKIPEPRLTIASDGGYVATAGHDITFNCVVQVDQSVDTEVIVNVTWIGPRSVLSNAVLTGLNHEYQSMIKIISIKTEEAGNYTCLASVFSANSSLFISPASSSTSIIVSVSAEDDSAIQVVVGGILGTLCLVVLVTIIVSVVYYCKRNRKLKLEVQIQRSCNISKIDAVTFHSKDGGDTTTCMEPEDMTMAECIAYEKVNTMVNY